MTKKISGFITTSGVIKINFKKVIFLFITCLSAISCFSQIDTTEAFKKKLLEMRKQRMEMEKKKPTPTNARTSFITDGGLVSFTPKAHNSSLSTYISITAGTVPPLVYNYEYATDMCSMWGIGTPPSSQVTYDNFYEWDVSYNNGATWLEGYAGQGSSLQLGVVTQSAIYRRYCYPWDWQGSITNGCGAFYSNIISINVIAAPVNGVNGGGISISASQSDNCLGRTVTFSSSTDASTTSNTPLIYQWQQKIAGSSGYTDIPNTNNSTYVATNITTTTTFRRKATDALNLVGYSNEVEVLPLMIGSSLSITNNSNVSISCGSVILNSTRTNVSNFNWQKENNGIYENILGATQSTYTATTSGNYRVTGNTVCDNTVIVSNICSVTILSQTLLGGTITPSTQTLTSGATPALLANATNPTGGNGSSYLYQWEQSNQFIGPFTEITNATSNSLQLGTLNQTTYYRRKTYQAGCSYGAYSNVSTITLPQIVSITGGSITVNGSTTNICSGSSVSFLNQTSATSTNSGTITYQWQEKVTGSPNYVDIPNANLDNYTATNVTQSKAFRRKATDALNNIGYSNEITLSLIVSSPSLAITNNSSVSSSCGSVILNAQASNVSNLQWQKENNGIYENILGATQSSYTASTSGNYRIIGNAQCTNALIVSNICSVTILSTIPGNSLDFGTGIWRFYGFEGVSDNVNSNVYKGFYDNDVPTNPNNVYTQDHWNPFTAPSNLSTNTPFTSDWYGCTMTNYSSLTVIAKRRGFDCGSYNLWVRVGGSDRLKLIVDGTVVRETYTAAPGFSNEYLSAPITLNANSTIEVWTSSSTAGTFINFEARRIGGTNLFGGTITPSTQTLTTGATPALLNNATNPTGGNGSSYLYQWEQSTQFIGPFTEITNTTSNSLQLGALYQTMYYRRKTYQAGCSYGAYSNVSTITLPQLLPITGGSITLNGATNTICSGSSPAIISNETLATNGTGVYTYVWQQSTGNSNQWTDIANTNSSSYQAPALTVSTKYRRKVTDNLNSIAYSNEISFTVNACFVALSGGTISYNNVSQTVVCANNSLNIFSSIQPAGGGRPLYTYLWQIKNSSTNNTWNDLQNSNSESYQPSPITNTTYFRRKVTDEVGTIAYSNEIVLTEASKNTALNPGSITTTEFVCNTNNNPLLVNISGASGSAVSYGYSYTWEQYQNGTWTVITTASANASNLQNATLLQPLSNSTGLYRRKVIDFCGIHAYSNTATVQAQYISAGSISTNQTSIFAGQNSGLIFNQIDPYTGTLNNTPANLLITWQQSTNLNGTWNVINGANALSYQPSSLMQTTYFKRVVKELQCNLTAESNVLTINVNTNPATFNGGIIQTANTCIQNGNSPGIIEPLANGNLGGTAPYTFAWEFNTNGSWVSIDNVTATSYTPSNLFITTSFRRKTTDATNSTAYSNIVTINVQFQQLKAGIIGKSVVVCPNINDTFFYEILSACGGYGHLSYQWEISNINGVWSTLPNSNAANYNLLNISADCKIRRKVFDACGNSAYTNEVEVFVYPAIIGGSIIPANQTVCIGSEPQNLHLTQNYHYTNGNVIYQWQKANSVNGPWTNVPNATNSVYIPKVPTSSIYYRLQVTSSMCNYVGYSSVAVVRGNDFCRTISNPLPKKK